jgi:hypothetical protein
MFRFIFYVIVFYIVVKALKAFFSWWSEPAVKNSTSSANQKKSYSNFPKYKDVEEAKFTEIKTDPKKEKV